jgi:hypothetical protein
MHAPAAMVGYAYFNRILRLRSARQQQIDVDRLGQMVIKARGGSLAPVSQQAQA